MNLKPRSRARSSSLLLRLAILGCLAGLLRHAHWGPAFNIKGSWDGTLADIRSLPHGLAPKSVGGLTFSHNLTNGFLGLAVDDGHVNVNYADGPLSLTVDDERAWQAVFSDDGIYFGAHGTGIDDVAWEASKQSSVTGLGDIEVNLNSAKDFGVFVAPEPLDVAGAKLKATASSQRKGLYGHLEAHRQFADNFDLSYQVENTPGEYAPADLKHSARFLGRLKDGTMNLQWGLQDQTQKYNATYTHNLDSILRGDAEVVAGVDNDGVYGAFSKSHQVSPGLRLSYEAAGRSDAAMTDPTYGHSAHLSHALGSLKLSHGNDRAVEANLESEVTKGATRLQSQLGYSSDEKVPKFNMTLSQDLADVFNKLGAEGELQVGIDKMTLDGLYGRVAARRKLGKGVVLDYSSGGRMEDIEHTLKLSNNLGYAQLVKPHDGPPRMRLGYEFDA